MATIDLNRVADGGVLKTLANGLQIIRRKKHEWSPALEKLDPKKLKLRTGKVWGSKFLDVWTLEVLVQRIETAVTTAGWTLAAQNPSPLDVVDTHQIGLVNGLRVRTMRIVCDGRYVHAYPI